MSATPLALQRICQAPSDSFIQRDVLKQEQSTLLPQKTKSLAIVEKLGQKEKSNGAGIEMLPGVSPELNVHDLRERFFARMASSSGLVAFVLVSLSQQFLTRPELGHVNLPGPSASAWAVQLTVERDLRIVPSKTLYAHSEEARSLDQGLTLLNARCCDSSPSTIAPVPR